MPRRGAIAIAITGLALVLLLSFKTPDDASLASTGTDAAAGSAATQVPATSDSSTGTSAGDTSASPTASPTQPDSGSADGVYQDGTVDGSVVSTRFGSMQVEVIIADGRIVDVVTLQVPSRDPRSVEISERAASVLRSAVLEAQTAEVDLVSGATYSSMAYLESLQAALDQAQA